MTRRTHAQVAAAAVAADRAAIVAYAERHCASLARLIARRQLSAEEASLLQGRIRAFASNLAAGFHVDG